jgi:hypothetical protein
MGSCKVWILQGPTYNRVHAYECEFCGSIAECLAYVHAIEPRYGWVISDSQDKFLCSGEVVEAWEKRSLVSEVA